MCIISNNFKSNLGPMKWGLYGLDSVIYKLHNELIPEVKLAQRLHAQISIEWWGMPPLYMYCTSIGNVRN